MLKILQSMSEFGELWKHQNNPARTKHVTVSRVLTEAGRYREGEESELARICLLLGTADLQYWSTLRMSAGFSEFTETTTPQSAKYWKRRSRRSFLRCNSSSADSEYSTMTCVASETQMTTIR